MDIDKWLRDERYDVCDRNMRCNGEVMEEAADEIERLREALQKIAAIEDEHINSPTTPSEANLWGIIEGCVRVADKALGGE